MQRGQAVLVDTNIIIEAVRDAEAFRLDAGERHLWAHATGRADAWIACCCDQAAVNVAVRLDWGDRIVSLEELAGAAGARRQVSR